MVGRARLDTQVDGDDARDGFLALEVTEGLHHVGLVRRHLGGERCSAHRGRLGNDAHEGGHGLVPQVLRAHRQRVTREDASAHRSPLADVAGDRTRVDVRDADDALRDQFVLQLAARAPVGGTAGGVAHDKARDPDARGFGILIVDAGVANVRGRHDDDLAVVRRVGERLLVAGHAGREHDLAERAALRAPCAALENGAVLQDEQSDIGRGHRSSLAIGVAPTTVGTPL